MAPGLNLFKWWGAEEPKGTPVVVKMESPTFSVVEIGGADAAFKPVEKTRRLKSAKQARWVLLLRAHRAAGCLARLAASVRRRLAGADVASEKLGKGKLMLLVIKFFLLASLLALAVEIAAHFNGWGYGYQNPYHIPRTSEIRGLFHSIYVSWLGFRGEYIAPFVHSLSILCVVLFITQSLDRLLLCLGCLYIKLKNIKPSINGDPFLGDPPLHSYPMVLVQIPMCNEREVYEMSISAVCQLDWPKERILIQVLDDSDDESIQSLIKNEVSRWNQKGINIIYRHRSVRTGYKAGNLQSAMSCDYVKDYEFVAIFDADFQPTPDFLKLTVPHFKDDHKLGLVQARWEFVNRDENLLTRLQNINLCFHFEVEQQVNGVFFNFFGFNGTAGVWRIEALEDSGGWLDRTTVEDMDIAVRAHLNGWKFIYLNDVKKIMVKEQNRRWSEVLKHGGGIGSSGTKEDRSGGDDGEGSDADFIGEGGGSELTAQEIREILRLQPSDHPGMQLVSTPLTGNNFYQWSRAIKRALGARNKLELLDGRLPEPEPNSRYHKAWITVDYMISNWITNSISKELVNAFTHLDTTQKLWDALNRRLGRCNGPKVYKLQKEIFSYRQGDQDVLMYFNGLTALWNEMDMLLPSLNFVCDAEKAHSNREEQQRLIQFLVGLRDEFEQVKQQILLIEPLPSVEKAYSMIVQVEDQMRLQNGRMEVDSRMAMQMGRQTPYRGTGNTYEQRNFKRRLTKEERRRLKCTHCHENGHEAHECFKLHGVPEWYKKLKESRDGERVNYIDEDIETRSEGEKNCGSEISQDIAKLIQSEIARCMSQFTPKDQGTSASTGINMVQGGKEKQTPFDGHYAFSALPSMEKVGWIIDSGASSHVCSSPDMMISAYRLEKPVNVYLPDGSVKIVTCAGHARVNKDIVLRDVLLVPGFTHNLLSVAQLIDDSKVKFIFLPTHCVIQRQDTDKIMGMGKMIRNMYVLETVVENFFCYNAFNPREMSIQQWHVILGHPSITTMKHMSDFTGKITEDIMAELEQCEICLKAKQCREPFPVLQRRTAQLFDMVHVDVWGPYSAENLCSTRYILTIVEDHSRVVWTYLLENKEKVHEVMHTYIKMVQNQFGRVVKVLRTDNGTEFVNHKFRHMVENFGILHQRSCVYSPQQNGIVERRHRTLLNTARALMFQSAMPIKFWPYSILTATWMINRLPSRVLDWNTPYGVLFGAPPDLNMLRPFGCLAYAVDVSPKRGKFDPRSNKCVFLGYEMAHKGFLLYDLQTHKVYSSRDVKFFPNTYPFSVPLDKEEEVQLPPVPIIQEPEFAQLPDSDYDTEVQTQIPEVEPPIIAVEGPTLRRSQREHHPPSWMQDYVGNVSTSLLLPYSASIISPTFPFLVSPNLTPSYVSFLFNITALHEPTTYKEASSSPEWVQAMDNELAALEDNKTWELVPLPPGKKTIGSKWVYKLKLKPNGELDRCKARLVAKGFNQEAGIDYQEVFSPVAKWVTVRMIIAMATSKHWHLHQIDVNNAFLHGFLHDDIYMLPPQGYKKAAKGEVCKLIKSLYGLKQASREWNHEFSRVLFAHDFQQSSHDHCLFTRGLGEDFICLLVYVDDVLVAGPNKQLIVELKEVLDTAFTIKDLGEAHYFLGMEIARGDAGTVLNQRKYVLDLVESVGYSGCLSVCTPLSSGTNLSTRDKDYLAEPDVYRRLVGRLLYLNLTRPDVTYAVQQLSQFVARPATSHLNAAYHVIKYLKGNPSLGLFYSAQSDSIVTSYCDADYGSCLDTRKALTGFCVFLGSSLISWRCKKQGTVSASSAEAEYRAMGSTVRELQWISYLLHDFQMVVSTPISLYCDNMAALHISKNPVFHERTKHLEIDCHIVRNQFLKGFILPTHVPSSYQLADLFTKVLPSTPFRFLLSKMSLVDIHHSHLEGGCRNAEVDIAEVEKPIDADAGMDTDADAEVE